MKKSNIVYDRLNQFDNLECLSGTYRNQSFPKHYHDTFCVGILERGSEILSLENSSHLVPANTVILIEPYKVHSNYQTDSEGWTYKMMYINEEIFTTFSNIKWQNIRFECPVIEHITLYNLIESFFKLKEHYNSEGMQNTLQQIVLKILEIGQFQNLNAREENIFDARLYLDEYYLNAINLDELSQKFKLNKFKFIRIFKQKTGFTPQAYVLFKRTFASKTLLINKIKISQVALECGFYDQSHFNRYFKQYIGITPFQYVKSCNIVQEL